MHNSIQTMLTNYDCRTQQDHINALKEIFQEIALLALWRAKFYDKAVFYGGTALRIFHGLDRFSEDLDFSLLTPMKNFTFQDYNQAIVDELNSFGFQVSVEKKEKAADTAIESAFIKANTQQQLISIEAPEALSNQIHHMNTIKIKMEVDTNPPGNFQTETKTLLMPLPFSVALMTPSNLFAGKIHALLCRPWQQRIKGRDWYDFIWYISRKIEVNLIHLKARLVQSNAWEVDQPLTHTDLIHLLLKKIKSIDFDVAKRDVLPFLKNKNATDVWSQSFFQEACRMLKTVSNV